MPKYEFSLSRGESYSVSTNGSGIHESMTFVEEGSFQGKKVLIFKDPDDVAFMVNVSYLCDITGTVFKKGG